MFVLSFIREAYFLFWPRLINSPINAFAGGTPKKKQPPFIKLHWSPGGVNHNFFWGSWSPRLFCMYPSPWALPFLALANCHLEPVGGSDPGGFVVVSGFFTGWWFQRFFIFTPIWGNDPDIFQMGWNHKLVILMWPTRVIATCSPQKTMKITHFYVHSKFRRILIS